MKGVVYLICDLDSNLYKIGVSNNSKKRKEVLQTGNASELHICREYSTNIPFKIENYLHRKYASKNILNEWFELSDSEALSFINDCRKIEDLFNEIEKNKKLMLKV